jgi:hypothetical protein
MLMVQSIILRLTVVLLLLSGGIAMPLLPTSTSTVAMAKDNGNQGKGNQGDDGNGQDKDKDGDKGKEKSKGKAKGNEKKRQKAEELTATTPYAVEVACAAVADGVQTECTFTGIAPEGAKKVGHVDLEESDVCTEVVGGDYEYVDPDPNTRVTGYKSKGSEASFTLVLDGAVTPAGQITYWVKAGGGVFPAPGPGLSCAAPAAAQAAEQAAPTTAPTPTAAPTTGEIAILAYGCPERPADPSIFDWFGACAPDGTARQFTLAPAATPDQTVTTETSDTGEARFADVAPGTYELLPVGDSWCNAKSDDVTAEGRVVVEAGQTTTIWAFYCPGKPST